MRKPLRKPQSEPIVVMPKKSKKSASKVETVFPKTRSQTKGSAPAVSFVELYRQCGRAAPPGRDPTPAATPPATPADSPDMARSDTSLATCYPARVARAQLMYELEYDQPYDLQAF